VPVIANAITDSGPRARQVSSPSNTNFGGANGSASCSRTGGPGTTSSATRVTMRTSPSGQCAQTE